MSHCLDRRSMNWWASARRAGSSSQSLSLPWRLLRTRPASERISRCLVIAWRLTWLLLESRVIDSGPADADDLQWGFASSPVLHDGKLIVLIDARGESYLAAYEVATGKGMWRTMRPTYPGWHTPTVHVDAERAQVITNGYKRTGGYDLNTGKELWWLEGGGDVPVPTPVVADGLIYITSAHGAMAPLYAQA